MIKILPILLLISCFVFGAYSANGVDLFAASSVATFSCFKNSGYTFAVIRAFRSSGILDTNAANNLQNAKAAGLSTDIYMFPCRGKDPTSQVNTLISGISTNLYSTVWIDV